MTDPFSSVGVGFNPVSVFESPTVTGTPHCHITLSPLQSPWSQIPLDRARERGSGFTREQTENSKPPQENIHKPSSNYGKPN